MKIVVNRAFLVIDFENGTDGVRTFRLNRPDDGPPVPSYHLAERAEQEYWEMRVDVTEDESRHVDGIRVRNHAPQSPPNPLER